MSELRAEIDRWKRRAEAFEYMMKLYGDCDTCFYDSLDGHQYPCSKCRVINSAANKKYYEFDEETWDMYKRNRHKRNRYNPA